MRLRICARAWPRPSLVRARLRADPRRGPDPPHQRAAFAERPARARPAQFAKLRHAPRLGIADLPRSGADPLHGPVAEPLAEHRAAAIAARWHDHLARERRRSAHTVRAYVATAHRLIAFLASHLGEEVD